jgi:phosphoenolpyruvate synthase/pyruvate phosphate dikinase
MTIISKTTASHACLGGKASSLQWLRDHGYPCPEFDVLDASCWDALLDGDLARRRIATVRHASDQLAFSLACHELQETIRRAPLVDTVADWLSPSTLERLGTPLAVRSSAVSEDVGASSSAGQYESILGVKDLPGLERALRTVLCSYYGERAALYRRAQRIDDGSRLAMGVIVQRMVPAAAAGIGFSMDPVTGATDRIIIEASWGLGQTVVSGQTEPDRFSVPRDADGAISVSVGRKARQLLYDEQSGAVAEVMAPPSAAASLTEAQVRTIAAHVVAMESDRGHAVDVEWAIAADASDPMYVQVRPVTFGKSERQSAATLASAY